MLHTVSPTRGEAASSPHPRRTSAQSRCRDNPAVLCAILQFNQVPWSRRDSLEVPEAWSRPHQDTVLQIPSGGTRSPLILDVPRWYYQMDPGDTWR
jgi:hypothetical protein